MRWHCNDCGHMVDGELDKECPWCDLRLARDEIERLTAERDRQYDQNVEQIAHIAELQARVKALEDACRTMDKTQIAIALAATKQGEVKTNDL